jgi:hypothetical protein
VIVVDEIGTKREASAVSTISKRGVTVIGSAHGTTLKSVVENQDICDLLGGSTTVILGASEVRDRSNGVVRKTQVERKSLPVFHVAIEVVECDRLRVYPDVKKAVDAMLRGERVEYEERWFDAEHKRYQAMFSQTSMAHASDSDWLEELARSIKLSTTTLSHY